MFFLDLVKSMSHIRTDTKELGKTMKEEDFLKEVQLIKEDVSEFRIPYSCCQYFHPKAKHYTKEQLDKAVDVFYRTMEERFGHKEF